MSTDDTNNTNGEGQASAEEPRGSSSFGWLAGLRARLGLPGAGQTLRDTLEYALQEEAGPSDSFSAQERQMLLRMLHFSATRVEDVMVPRADIIAIDESDSMSDLLATFERAGVSRVPLFAETLDDPRGMIHIKDFFRWILAEAGHITSPKPAENGNGAANAMDAGASDEEFAQIITKLDLGTVDLMKPVSSAKLKRPVLYVPPSMPAMNLLIKMQSTRIHMALVVDEYGGTDGLVTIEDLVEQVVGDIEDEHDEAEVPNIVKDPKQGLIASARAPVEELEKLLDRKLLTSEEEEDIDTLGGLVFTIVGRVPARGELIQHHSGLEFEVLDADPRRVKKLKIHVPAPGAPASQPAPPVAIGGA